MATQGASEVTALDLLRFTDGLVVHQALFAAANLGVADLLKEGARSAADLAASLHVNADALYRTMRFLAGQGVFYETAARTFVNSPLSEWLRADVAGSIRSILIYRGGPNYYGPFAELLSSIKTGAPVREKTGAASVFEHLQQNPRDACIFDDAMTDLSMIWGASVAGAYDFGRWGSLMDIGGGSGLLLATILKARPFACRKRWSNWSGFGTSSRHISKTCRTSNSPFKTAKFSCCKLAMESVPASPQCASPLRWKKRS